MSDIPYPGLRPFKRDESDIFFGREEQTDQLLEKLSQTRFISVVGLSGCGKSSLVRAGMFAALETGYLSNAGAQWRMAAMRPGNQPLYNLAKTLLEKVVLPRDNKDEADVERLSGVIASHGPLGLVEVLRETPLPEKTNLLLLVDQFEEIFRYYREENLDEAEAFVDLLLTSAEQREVPIYVVITMRSDFIGNCALFHDLPEMLNSGQFLIPRLTREQQRMAAVGPAKVFGGDIEPRLVNRLLEEMGNDPDQLPLLQHCLMRMWFRARTQAGERNESEQNGINMTLEDYETTGGLKDALSNHAEEAFAELDQKGQHIAKTMFRCLSERGSDQRDTRRLAKVREIATVAKVSASEVMKVVEVFRHPDRCFLTPAAGVPLEPDSVLDISHESLIRQWRRMSGWVEQEADSTEKYRHLERTAMLWRQGHAALWRSPDLDIALKWKEEETPTQEWASRYGNHFDLAIEFLETSEQEERRSQKERERQRGLKLKYARRQLAVVIVGLVIAVGLAVWAIWERSNVQKAKTEVELALAETKKAKAATENALAEAKEARKVAEGQRQLALVEKTRAENALVKAEERRKEAEEARKVAEEQTQRALTAEKVAKDAGEKAEARRKEAEEAHKVAEEQRQLALVEKTRAENALVNAEERRREAEEARKVAEEQTQRALTAENGLTQALEDTKNALAEAENQRREAEDARQRMEELTQQAFDAKERAEEVKQRAEEVQKEAELNSSVIQTVINATFGYLLEVERTEEFLTWFERKELPVESLDRALELMIESSTGMDEEQKQAWLDDDLPTMTREAKNELLGDLAIEAANRARVAVNINVEPDIRSIYIGLEKEITLAARTNKPGLQFKWEHTGPGAFVGNTTSPDVSYIPPDVITSKSVQTVITVIATDDQRRTATNRVIFTLLPSSLEILSIEQLVEMAENTLKHGYLTTPEIMNAFDICKEILGRDTGHPRAREIIYEIAERYKIWGDPRYGQAFRESNENRYNQTVIIKAKMYYERYVTVATYIEKTLKDRSVKSERKEVEKRLRKLKSWEKKLSQ